MTLREGDRRELACASCGAPLHNLKMLRKDNAVKRGASQPTFERVQRAKSKSPSQQRRRKKPRPRRSFAKWVLNEAIDVLDDVFD